MSDAMALASIPGVFKNPLEISWIASLAQALPKEWSESQLPGPTMSLNAVSLAPITAYITSHLTAGWRSLRGRRSAETMPASEDIWPTPPVSRLLASQAPGLLDYAEEVDPLTEAEVYLLFGRLDDARAVLEGALDEGRLSEEEVARFLAERNARR